MSKRTSVLLTLLFATMTILAQGVVRNDSIRKSIKGRNRAQANREVTLDTIEARYPIAETVPQSIDDIEPKTFNLKTPSNIVTDTTYNDVDGTYRLSTRLGQGSPLTAPILLTPEEYAKWQERNSMSRFFRKKNFDLWESSRSKNKFDFTDMHFDLGPAL